MESVHNISMHINPEASFHSFNPKLNLGQIIKCNPSVCMEQNCLSNIDIYKIIVSIEVLQEGSS